MNHRLQILLLATASRAVLLLAMSFSCAFVPDFDPGSDVLQFDLRLSSNNTCFCLGGHACDPSSTQFGRTSKQCIDDDFRTRNLYIDGMYRFILPSITKWDSARFLTLAVDPWARYPDWSSVEDATYLKRHDGDNVLFQSSEQLHAFLPFFPLCIRYVTNALVVLLPRDILPSTYEATAALSAIIINVIAFSVAAVALYELTLYLLMGEMWFAERRRKDLEKKDQGERLTTTVVTADCEAIAKLVAIVFCLNPAGVFFTAAYSESLFAMLTFTGHAITVKYRYFRYKTMSQSQVDTRQETILMKWYPIPTNILWALASYTRSNGVLSTAVWWIVNGIGVACLRIQDKTGTSRHRFVAGIIDILYNCGMGLTLFVPVLYHDYQGYNFHCTQQLSVPFVVPEWCHYSGKFSLYAYVQRKHWNVGLFRYYELKQIPNFILAAPVLCFSVWAAVKWIRISFLRHSIVGDVSPYNRIRNTCRWAILALGASPLTPNGCNENTTKQFGSVQKDGDCIDLLYGSTFLPYYAILFGFVLLGLFLAHVQISTRLICSSCPALYWFLATLYLRNKTREFNVSTRWVIGFYFGLYNLLGVIMHVNWLPWT